MSADQKPEDAAVNRHHADGSMRRYAGCAERNPFDDETHQSCCRFPKSCSPYPHPETPVTEADLEPRREQQVVVFRDYAREEHPEPCRDCGRTHLNGEHISWRVATPVGSECSQREVWSGCIDCFVVRTNPPFNDSRSRDEVSR